MSVSVHDVLNDPSSTAPDEPDATHIAPQTRCRPLADSLNDGERRG